MRTKSARLSAVALAVALGVVTALSMMLFAWSAWLWGYGEQMIAQSATLYPGFDASLKGGFVGGAWGFLEGFIFGLVTSLIYNLCLCCCNKSCNCGNPSCPACNNNNGTCR